jgi:hypothetical protein
MENASTISVFENFETIGNDSKRALLVAQTLDAGYIVLEEGHLGVEAAAHATVVPANILRGISQLSV